MREKESIISRWLVFAILAAFACFIGASLLQAQPQEQEKPLKTAAILTCYEMIDHGLYQSVVRRSEEAVRRGVDYIILDIQTYGGLVKSADDISKYLILDLAKKARTVAYVSTEAISAGAMISVSCQDIIMRQNTTIGCSAPIVMGDTEMGEAEREKAESFVRAAFSRAAQANGYPEALLKAMVTQKLEVWQVKNKKSRTFEYFEKDYLPTDPNLYDLADKKLVVKEGELLTLTDQKALEYGIARAVVQNEQEMLDFLAKQDGVVFSKDILRLETLWSEELVRWLNSPVVVSILILGILLGIYIELHTPGLGLPSLAALVCLVILVGSKYLTGLANWIEVAILVLGIILLLLEIFVIPGFGITGIAGIVCILVGFFAMLVKNRPDEIPWPQTEEAWTLFAQGVLGIIGGVAGFLVIAWVLAKYMPKLGFLSGFILVPAIGQSLQANPPQQDSIRLAVGDRGAAVTPLRPAGTARIGGTLYDVVCQAEFIDKASVIEVVQVSGNRIVVKKIEEPS
ncbi:MAG: hypothetical protein KBI46_03010 [Phycisphaerae bacterium]|nr:hypothetical protein [Phycisphaerae bacterium]